MKYFLVNGILTNHSEVYEKIGNGVCVSSDNTTIKKGLITFFRRKDVGSIYKYSYDSPYANILISARSQKKAYILGNALKAILVSICQTGPSDDVSEFLVELNKRPSKDWDIKHLVACYNNPDYTRSAFLGNELQSGTVIDEVQFKKVCQIMAQSIEHPHLLLAFEYLERSYTLYHVCDVDYFGEQRLETPYLRQKRYFEHRTTIDLAFLSAFRSIEAIFNVSQIKKSKIVSYFAKLDIRYKTNFSNGIWRSYHEIFSGGKKYRSYTDVIGHFLDLRNAKAAHNNPLCPITLREDQVLEIQYFVTKMLLNILSLV